ncbi:MAG: hypothetical protein NW203_04595 [Hyphomonadaceae bacterium]|nr:hypothetical protein [Hyphomonadaceae bacterium]
MELAALSFLHVLVFVYWLGGDLGAFAASFALTNDKAAPAARLAAAKLLGDLDMAPRTALILAAPTGLALAEAKGWLALGAPLIAAVWAGSLVWLALAWRIHLKHGAAPWSRRVDLAIRVAALVALAAAAAMAPIEGVLRIKLALLAGAIACGLFIRYALRSFGPALAPLAAGAPTPQSDAAIADALRIARPGVIAIWALISAAAWLGLSL